MAATAELSTLHRALDELRTCVGALRSRYGDIPPVRRLVTDLDRLSIDASELDAAPPPTIAIRAEEVQPLTDEPLDPSLWADADDEGIGGYHHQ